MCSLHRCGLEFRQFSFRRITRALPHTALHAFGTSRRFQQAIVPSSFRPRVSWMAQGQFSRAPLNCVESLGCLMTWRTCSDQLFTSFDTSNLLRRRNAVVAVEERLIDSTMTCVSTVPRGGAR